MQTYVPCFAFTEVARVQYSPRAHGRNATSIVQLNAMLREKSDPMDTAQRLRLHVTPKPRPEANHTKVPTLIPHTILD